MDFEPAKAGAYAELYTHNGFRICSINDRWFASDKESTAVFYGYDLTTSAKTSKYSDINL